MWIQELQLKFQFEASHSLAGYEEPHSHFWRLEVAVQGESRNGRIIDLVKLREQVQAFLNKINLTFLNENNFVSEEVRSFPTCETLSFFFKDELTNLIRLEFSDSCSSVRLSSVLIAICEMNGSEIGAARLAFVD